MFFYVFLLRLRPRIRIRVRVKVRARLRLWLDGLEIEDLELGSAVENLGRGSK